MNNNNNEIDESTSLLEQAEMDRQNGVFDPEIGHYCNEGLDCEICFPD